MATISNLHLTLSERDDRPGVWNAVADYTLNFTAPELASGFVFHETFRLRDADDPGDPDDLLIVVNSAPLKPAAATVRRSLPVAITEGGLRTRSDEDDIELYAEVIVTNDSLNVVTDRRNSRARAINLSLP